MLQQDILTDECPQITHTHTHYNTTTHQLAEFIGQLLHHHTETLQLLKHTDQVFAGEPTDHLQICGENNTIHPFIHSIMFISSRDSLTSRGKRLPLPLVLCPVYSVLMADEPLRFSKIILSVAADETDNRQLLNLHIPDERGVHLSFLMHWEWDLGPAGRYCIYSLMKELPELHLKKMSGHMTEDYSQLWHPLLRRMASSVVPKTKRTFCRTPCKHRCRGRTVSCCLTKSVSYHSSHLGLVAVRSTSVRAYFTHLRNI